MEVIRNLILRKISSTHLSRKREEVVQILTSLFECLKKESNHLISGIKYLRNETNALVSDLKDNISTLEKKWTV